jgi:hypothetical protein
VERQLEEKDSFEDITICRNLADLNKKQKKKKRKDVIEPKGIGIHGSRCVQISLQTRAILSGI